MPELIDRRALLEAYDRSHKGPSGGARKLIAEAPTIEAEHVRHGRWIEGTSRGSFSIYCSYCGSYKETICPSEYCPNCGARMDATDTNVGGKGGADNG